MPKTTKTEESLDSVPQTVRQFVIVGPFDHVSDLFSLTVDLNADDVEFQLVHKSLLERFLAGQVDGADVKPELTADHCVVIGPLDTQTDVCNLLIALHGYGFLMRVVTANNFLGAPIHPVEAA